MKRLISTSNDVETIINIENPDNISAFFNNAIIDSIMPQYSLYLKTECHFLWDFSVNGAKNWKGNRLIILNGARDIDFVRRQTIGRTLIWLKNNHHIKDGTLLKEHLAYFIDEKIDLKKVNEYTMKEIKNVLKRLNQSIINENNYDLTAITKLVLSNWDSIWDFNEIYSFLQATIMLSENQLDNISDIGIIRLVQAIEYQYIKETLKEDQI